MQPDALIAPVESDVRAGLAAPISSMPVEKACPLNEHAPVVIPAARHWACTGPYNLACLQSPWRFAIILLGDKAAADDTGSTGSDSGSSNDSDSYSDAAKGGQQKTLYNKRFNRNLHMQEDDDAKKKKKVLAQLGWAKAGTTASTSFTSAPTSAPHDAEAEVETEDSDGPARPPSGYACGVVPQELKDAVMAGCKDWEARMKQLATEFSHPLRVARELVGDTAGKCHGCRHCTKIGCLRPMSLPKFVGNQWEMIGLESEECGERARVVQRVCVGVVGDTH
ncbi:hypothetical protein B0H17DRAFT_1150486 [Mycena rosella]|uniref:Uncharacterized protein n=1 Tax=Mycena rosella TaxID=1033263 RepID=A0AAD7BSJ3_MYCRO|nr:hypothetical protein B0H17DRAFT_1150486 [Mycena rosella]